MNGPVSTFTETVTVAILKENVPIIVIVLLKLGPRNTLKFRLLKHCGMMFGMLNALTNRIASPGARCRRTLVLTLTLKRRRSRLISCLQPRLFLVNKGSSLRSNVEITQKTHRKKVGRGSRQNGFRTV